MIVEICNDRDHVTQKLLSLFCEKVKECLKTKKIVKIAVATGNTYSDFLKRLHEMDIPFNKIDLFVVDEYVGVDCEDERSCTIDLCRELKQVHRFHQTFFFSAETYLEQMKVLNAKLVNDPLDIVLLGIGNDGHFAFCNRNEQYLSKDTYSIVHFTNSDIEKQVEYGWFPSSEEVPKEGITITKYGVLKSGTVILAGFQKEKGKILKMILANGVPKEMAIYDIVQRNDVILVLERGEKGIRDSYEKNRN